MVDLISEQEQYSLTRREREVLVLIARGLTNEQIAIKLGTRVSTVKAYLHQVFVKLNVRNRSQAVIEALKKAHLAADGLYSVEELADWWACIGPEVLEEAAQILRRRQEKQQNKIILL